jgi:hypothetical protein
VNREENRKGFVKSVIPVKTGIHILSKRSGCRIESGMTE